MDTTQIITLIKSSFESWYNAHVSKENPVNILINYRDEQKLRLKAFHTATIELQALKLEDSTPVITPIVELQEIYNHGLLSSLEMKEEMLKKLLIRLYSFSA